ncbi:hypothetical protein OROMI_002992 [Orobanche minor]
MDGRRHSVDVPISRTLVELRRVRSLRDPSTRSMSKLSALVDNLNWETNSNNAITLGFDNSDHELYYGSKHCNSEMVCGNNTMTEKYCDNSDDKGSCDEREEICRQNEKKRNGGPNCNIWHRKLEELSRARDDDVFSRLGSSCSSFVGQTREEGSTRAVSLYINDDVGFMGSCHQGCGISSCWSRTRKFRDNPSILPDVEKRPLLLTGESPYLDSPRNLCQKFTPKSFSELIGQHTIATSLLNAISSRQINSLYLFHGPRGIGKTSASRLFAAALNCLSPNIARKPCGSCQECGLFFSGQNRDFKEVDPLRINRMEKCRSLVKSARVPPVSSRFKVYVIDECHLLYRETWAVILSVIDELPRNVVFVMVTPNPDKVPRSVVLKSRGYCFQRIKEVDIVSRLGEICVQEGIEFEEDALTLIASKSNGSIRDAEMMLDQLSLLGKKINVSLVHEVNGVVSNDELLDLLYLALSSDASNTVKMARELMRSRIEPLQLVSQLANLIMDLLAGKVPVGVSEVRKKLFGTENTEADVHQLSQALKILSQTEKQLRMSKNQTTWLTVALLQLSSAEPSHDVTGARLSTTTLNPPENDFHSTSSTGESLKCSVACACNEDEPEKIGTKDDKETLEFVWFKATGICTPCSFKKFLRKRGKLVAIRLMHAGTAIAELEFDRTNSVAKAEKSWKVIAGALQRMLGHNVELRINLAHKDRNEHPKLMKVPYFSLFNCSRRVHLNFLSECKSNALGNSQSTPTTQLRDKYVETCSSECGSQIPHACCRGKELFKSIRSKDGNALGIGVNKPSMKGDDGSGVKMWDERFNNANPNSVDFKPESKCRSKGAFEVLLLENCHVPFPEGEIKGVFGKRLFAGFFIGFWLLAF